MMFNAIVLETSNYAELTGLRRRFLEILRPQVLKWPISSPGSVECLPIVAMTDLTVYEIDSFDDIEEIVQIDIENDETVSEFLGGPAPESRDIEELTVPAAGSHAETESDRFVTTAYNSFSKFVESFDD